MDRYNSFLQLLEAQDQNKVAFEFLNDNQLCTLKYSELIEKIKLYKKPEVQTVGFFIDSTPESLVAFFALAGKTRLVLLNPADPEDVLLSQIRDTDVSCFAGAVPEILQNIVLNSSEKISDEDKKDILFFTSGTTDSSKAVVLTEQSLCSAAFNGSSMLALKKEDKLLCLLPLTHVFGLVCSLLWPLCFGCTVCLGNGISSFFSDFDLYRPTAVCLVPQMAKIMAVRKLFNSELKLILIGAGVCDDLTLDLIKKAGIFVSYGYGLTETSSGIALSIGDNPRLMSVCPDYTVKIAQDGEILVKSTTTIMKGYYKNKAATEKVFKDGYLCTGDFGSLTDNKLIVSGRKKDVLIFSDGSKLFIPEYEQKLSGFLGQGTDFAIYQEENGTITLYIHKDEDLSEIIDKFNETLPRSHRISSVVRTKTNLPRTATGKVKRYDLPRTV